jgi:hypothetical protein
MAAKIRLCSPFPSAPKNWEINTAISKLKTAVVKRTLKLPMIDFIMI